MIAGGLCENSIGCLTRELLGCESVESERDVSRTAVTRSEKFSPSEPAEGGGRVAGLLQPAAQSHLGAF